MKYQMTVDGVLVADYYNLEKALDHTFVAMEDGRFASVTLAKIQDDGTPYNPNQQIAQAESPSPVEVPPAPELGPDGQPVSSDPTAAAPVQL